jgi:tetratricopeptide (TPR) repeat protein
VLEILKETGPDLLALIPGLGTAAAILKISVKAASVARQRSLASDSDTRADLAESMMGQYVDTILALADRHGPLVLIIEDAHWSDTASAQLFSRLARVIRDKKLLLVATYRPNFLIGTVFRNIRQELLMLDETEPIDLQGFTEAQVKSYIEQRYQSTPADPGLVAWLTQLSGGSPMFITHYLTLLEDQEIIRVTSGGLILDYDLRNIEGEWVMSGPGGELPTPRNVKEVVDQRIDRLANRERQLLELGSVQGFKFMSLVLMALLPSASSDILSELRCIELEDHVIKEESPQEWARRETEMYSFEHTLLRQALYNKLGRLQRLNYHGIVATVLENLLGRIQELGASVPRRLVLEIVINNRLAENYQHAATYGLQAAQSCYEEGAFADAASLCENVTTDLAHVEDHQPDDELLYAHAVEILLATAEPQWFSKSAEEGSFVLTELIERARAAAQAAADRRLEARLQFFEGRNLIVTGSLDRAVEKLEAARHSLHDVDDIFGEISALIELGHHRMGIDVASGVETLQEARQLLEFNRRVVSEQVPARALDRIEYKLKGAIGLCEFDRGNFDSALDSLEDAVAGLERAEIFDLHAIDSNYLAQVLIASGQFARAQQVLEDTLRPLTGEQSHRVVQSAYNLALLGKLYIEWGRSDDAAGPLQEAWRKIQANPDNSIVPLIANYYVELLIDPKSPTRDTELAGKLLDWNIKQSSTLRFERSVVTAKCLMARLAILRRQPEQGPGKVVHAV